MKKKKSVRRSHSHLNFCRRAKHLFRYTRVDSTQSYNELKAACNDDDGLYILIIAVARWLVVYVCTENIILCIAQIQLAVCTCTELSCFPSLPGTER